MFKSFSLGIFHCSAVSMNTCKHLFMLHARLGVTYVALLHSAVRSLDGFGNGFSMVDLLPQHFHNKFF